MTQRYCQSSIRFRSKSVSAYSWSTIDPSTLENDLVSPRSLIHALYVHWDVIESLVILGRDFPSFDQAQVIEVIARRAPGKSNEECEAAMRQMTSNDLLQVMPRGSSLQINPLVLEFVRGLTRAHEGIIDV